MKYNWLTVGSKVEHRRTGQVGEVLVLRGSLNRKDQRYLIKWEDDGKEQWVSKKQLKQIR